MTTMKILTLCSFILLASCASRKNNYTVSDAAEINSLAGVIRATETPQLATDKTETANTPEIENVPESIASQSDNKIYKPAPVENNAALSSPKKAKTFAQMKEMVKNGTITMSKKDQKVLNKLDQLSQSKKSPMREDPFELTTLAKIIFGIGAVASIIFLFSGSLFFLFLFLVAVGAFFCRWFGIIDF
ncbi:MAG: hypothetical protein V4722_28950 [Bacteroidota bacterium]